MGLFYKTQLEGVNWTNTLIDYTRARYQLFCDIISKGISEHAFHSPLSADETARHFVTAYRGLVLEWCLRYPDFDLKEQTLRHFQILLNGIQAPVTT